MCNFSKSNNIAIIEDNGNIYSYKDLNLECDNLKKNIYDRCLVFCLCKNCYASLFGYVCFLNHKIVPVMLDSKLDKNLLKFLIETYKPDYLWLPTENQYEFNFKETYSSKGYSLLKTNYNKEYPLHSDLALLLTTSGSTGSPKLVKQTYKNIL